MEIMDVIRQRHSVRQYLNKPIPQEIREKLDECAAALNRESGLHMQILYDEPECFSSRMAHYGKFENADNYIALVGKKGEDLDERCGFYGEKPVPFEWTALYGDEWTLHYSLIVGADIPNGMITIANPYGYYEEITLEELLNRTSFQAYKNMPLFLRLGFAMGIFEKNTIFSVK